jgi:CubicO group peptidase (beta-lactamase class C family)
LVERGALSLDSPIAAVLPALARPQVLEGFGADGLPLLRAARTPITLRRLLSHTAGYGYNLWSASLQRCVTTCGMPRIPDSWEAAARVPLLADPGTVWNYGINTDIVGKAVEVASGRTLAEYLAAQVLEPLGMSDTTFELSAEQRSRLAGMHLRAADGTLSPLRWPVGEGQGFAGGGGGLCGTARDYGRFLRMVLNGGQLDGVRLLRDETVAEMGRNQIGGLAAGRLVSAVPERSNDVDLFPGIPQKWGLGFLINTEPGPNGRRAFSLAWGGLANCYYWIDPARGVGGVLLMQVLPFGDPAALRLFGAFERGVYARLNGPSREPAAHAPEPGGRLR